MIPALTSVSGSAKAQNNPIPTSRHISYDLPCTCCLYDTPRDIDGTGRNAIRDSTRLGQHCQARLWEETSLCEVRAPHKILHTEQDTTHFLFFDGDKSSLTIIFSPRVARQRITSVINWDTWNIIISWTAQTSHESKNNMHYWTRYIFYTSADEHGDQLVQNRPTGRHLRQGSSSWTTTPAAAIPAQRTGTQPCTLQFCTLWSNPSPQTHPRACWTPGEERCHPHQP